MSNRNHRSRGFTLIAALLIMVLLSGLAVGLMYMASNEVAMGGNDQEQNLANYGAESGMEQLTANLYTLYQAGTNPTGAQVQALATQYPSAALIPNMNYTQVITYAQDANGNPVASGYNPISSGPNQGLIAQIIPMTLQVTASRNAIVAGASNSDDLTAQVGGASVNITRRVEVSLIPVFQFGVFCDGDCDWFAGPPFSFGGRVHANGNLFLASGGSVLEFSDKIQAAGQIILDQLENNWPTNNQYQGNVLVPNAAGGCPLPANFAAGPNCIQITEGYNQLGDASWSGGFAPLFGVANGGFAAVAAKYNGFYLNGATGANVLSLPFVQSNNGTPVDQEQIVRKPIAGEVTGASNLSNSRLYNKAAIRILLADNIADLHPERGAGALAGDIQLNSNLNEAIPGFGTPEYFAMAQTAAPWTNPPTGETTPWSLLGKANNTSPNNGPWLRVEYMTNAATIPPTYAPVTQQWLNYGFGRGNFDAAGKAVPPSAPWGNAGANNISPAILILQELQTAGLAATGLPAANTQYNWYPINFYDAREGEPRDYNGFVRVPPAASCNPIGVMNAVELDVGNLWLWLQHVAPYAAGSGNLVNGTAQNGYVLYFSDHRGMQPDPNTTGGGAPPVSPAGVMSGVSGLEDTINSASAAGTPDNALEPIVFYNTPPPPPGKQYSPEDVDKNGRLDNWGEVNLANGFPGASNVAANIYADTIGNCSTTGRVNLVAGARHVLRLVDGGMSAANISYLPGSVAAPATSGFTVASEEPVYVYGNYNTGPADPLWANPSVPTAQHAAAAIIADSVTLLTNQWRDIDSLTFPATLNCAAGAAGRCGGTTDGINFANGYYRMAIASGKSIPFPNPGYAGANAKDFGTDGGMHNFLRYLEDMGNISINYSGSMVSLYYSQYATGVFKCCGVVYQPPVPRNYNFDTLFLNPANLPPGTPAFQDIVNLSYHQNFTPQ